MSRSGSHDPRWRQRLRRVRRLLVYGGAVVLIVLGVLVGTAAQLLPLVERHPERVAAWLSQRTGQAIGFDQLQAQWTRRGPLLSLQGLRIGTQAEPFHIDQAQLLVSIYSGLVPGQPLTELRLRGLALELNRDAQGRWSAAGLGGEQQADTDLQATLDALQGLGEVQVRDASLAVRIDDGERSWSIPRVDLRLRVGGRRIRLGLLGFTDAAREPVVLVADLARRSGDGQVHVRAQGAELAQLAGEGDWLGVTPLEGRLDLDARLGLGAQRVVSVSGQLQLDALVLQGSRVPAPEAADVALLVEPVPRHVTLDSVSLQGAWQVDDGRWRLQLPQALLASDGQVHDFSEVVGQGEDARMALALDQAHLGPLLRIASLFEPLSPALQDWLWQAAPQGRLEAVELTWIDGAPGPGRARLAGLSFGAAGERPGVSGLGGTLAFDARGAVLELDPEPLAISWPRAWDEPLRPSLSGSLALWRHGEAWHVGGSALRVRGEDYGAQARLELRFQPDGGRPWLALAADVDPAPLTLAPRFWVRHQMPPATLDWLERALVSGSFDGGQAVLVGDLDDWPFAGGEGVFDAEARLSDVELAFHPDWPNATGLSGSVGFSGSGMRLQTSGEIAGIAVHDASGSIEDWRNAVLRLQAEGTGGGTDMLALLRASPLQARHGEQIETLQVQGATRTRLDLALPLGSGKPPPTVRGTVDLDGVRLADPRWDLEFTQASGRLRYSEAGMSAEELSVRYQGQVGSLSLAVGGHTSSEQRLVEASLRGRFGVASLLARVEALDPLAGRITGAADMVVGLRVPRLPDGTAGTAMLGVRSDLLGVDLDLPAPLRKRAQVALPLRVDVALPVEADELQVRLGGLAHLRGRLDADHGLVGMLALGQPAEALPDATTLSVLGQVAVLDAAGWAGLATDTLGGGAAPADPAPEADADPAVATGVPQAPPRGTRVGEFDVFAGQLDLLDRAFIETRLRLSPIQSPGESGYRLDVDGPELLGEVRIPGELDRGLVGRFERLHWPAGRQASAGGMTIDPSGVPPLDFQVADLRFGDAVLGEARLLTYPTPEGMQVQRLQAQSADMAFNAVGSWSLIDGSAFSRFSLGFTSGDLGRMLASLGYAGIVQGGETEASLVAGWVGSPAAFGLDAVQGTLEVQVGQGRVLDVEPGAGRLLGLVSLAELPRRLTLDFSDFFGEGFGFNAITGSFVLGDGRATTNNLLIDGPAARITVRGSTALQAQTYDQTIEVLPRTGSVLPVVGAITGGPAGAAIGALAQAILNRPFSEAARTVYRVTGPWSAPQVEVVERGPAPRPAPLPADDPANAPAEAGPAAPTS